MRFLKYILLPVLGLVAAILAFKLAMPYEGTLSRPNIGHDDPQAFFTYGTKWGEVNRIAFGALVGGPFCVALTLGRRSFPKVIWCGVMGAALGGLVNYITDSASDLIGLCLSGQSVMFGSLMAMIAWCVLVPAGITFSITVTLGVTAQRIQRALYAFKAAAIASFCVQMIGGFLAAPDVDSENMLASQIPVWRLVEMAVGVALGVTILVADERVRAGSIRLMHGRNEFRDWSLDHLENVIGSAEGCQIPIFGYNGIEPIHAVVQRQGSLFVLNARALTFVNGQQVGQAALQSGDRIKVGNAELVFTYGGTLLLAQRPLGPAQPFVTPPSHFPIQTQPRVLADAHGQQVPLTLGQYSVGQHHANSICLSHDPKVAPHHADLVVAATGITLIDFGTPQGTKRNGVQVQGQIAIQTGDVLEFGSTTFTVVA